ncbi:MAG: hypothetical protein GF329_08200 [Candidatus Lokiarchaeota archaeon]|nr:hypothetical protein [Candidatus Lokiarchaeota archaeon]
MKNDKYSKKGNKKDWDLIKEEFQKVLWNKTEEINKYNVQTVKPTNIILTLKDNEGSERKINLISILGRGGVLGKPLQIKKDFIDNLMKKYQIAYPYVSRILFYDKPYFPYSSDEEKIKFSPLFILINNTGYIKNKIGPYNVEMAGFLITYIPAKGIYLEAVTKSVAGTVSVIENIMKKNNEPYTRKNHLLNWLYYIISGDSAPLKVSIFNMKEKYMADFKEYMELQHEKYK